jgi:hypothetical protein
MTDPHTAMCRVPVDSTIVIPKNCSLEVIAAQLQPFTDKYLYVVDDVMLNYYSSLDEVTPAPRRLEPANTLGYGQRSYYIRDLSQRQLICCFNSDLCHKLIGTTDKSLRKSESNPDLPHFPGHEVARNIRIVTRPPPEQVSSEPKTTSKSSRSSSPNKVSTKKSTRSERDNQRGKVVDLTNPVEIAPSVTVTKRI